MSRTLESIWPQSVGSVQRLVSPVAPVLHAESKQQEAEAAHDYSHDGRGSGGVGPCRGVRTDRTKEDGQGRTREERHDERDGVHDSSS